MHTSLILGGHLFVMGGLIGTREYQSSIECQNIAEYSTWHTLVEGSQLVKRGYASVAAVSATKLIVFGGVSGGDIINTGYIFDIKTL